MARSEGFEPPTCDIFPQIVPVHRIMDAFAKLDFGILIAYFLPGFVSIFSVSYLSPRVQAVLDDLLTKDLALGSEAASVE